MIDSSSKKGLPLLLLNVLKEYSDESHPLTQQKIIDYIKNDYGIEYERKAISTSIQFLIDELDYDIINIYRHGWYLGEREFNDSEIKFLIDAVFSSKAIPGDYAKELANKLSKLTSKYNRKDYNKFLYKSSELTRTDNKEIFSNIEVINEAIKLNRQIEFKMDSYDKLGNKKKRMNDYSYHVSPYFLVNSTGKYYLIGHKRRKDAKAELTTFRLDLIRDIKIRGEDKLRYPINEIEGCESGFDISEYVNSHIYMFGGEASKIKLELKNGSSIQYVYDWFGTNAKVYTKDEKIYADIKCNEQGFVYWALQYSEHITVLSPQNVIDKIKSVAESIVKKY